MTGLLRIYVQCIIMYLSHPPKKNWESWSTQIIFRNETARWQDTEKRAYSGGLVCSIFLKNQLWWKILKLSFRKIQIFDKLPQRKFAGYPLLLKQHFVITLSDPSGSSKYFHADIFPVPDELQKYNFAHLVILWVPRAYLHLSCPLESAEWHFC